MTQAKSIIIVAILSLITLGAFARNTVFRIEEKPKFPPWVSDKGYWVIESNMSSPKDHVISFYNTENLLVYKETLTNISFNPDKRKVRMKLKKILETSVVAWQIKKRVGEKMALVKSVL